MKAFIDLYPKMATTNTSNLIAFTIVLFLHGNTPSPLFYCLAAHLFCSCRLVVVDRIKYKFSSPNAWPPFTWSHPKMLKISSTTITNRIQIENWTDKFHSFHAMDQTTNQSFLAKIYSPSILHHHHHRSFSIFVLLRYILVIEVVFNLII